MILSGPETSFGQGRMIRTFLDGNIRRFAAYLSCIIAIILFSYWNILDSYFLSDDFNHIFSLYRPDGSLRWYLALDHWVSSQHAVTWRPLVTVYELAVLAVFGVSPIAFHLGSLALHLANCLLLTALVARLGGDAGLPGARWAAVGAGLLFAAHPLHPEAVTWIAANPVLLCGLFSMASLLLVRRWVLDPRRRWLVAAIGCAVLAFAGKEEAVALPGLVALVGALTFVNRHGLAKWHVWFGRYFMLMCLFCGLLIAYFLLRVHIFGAALSIVSLEGPRQLRSYALALYHNTLRFFAPVNFEHAAGTGRELARLYGGVAAGVLLLASVAALRAGARRLLVAVGAAVVAFLMLLVPVHPVIVGGPGSGLDLSRFLYLPSAAAVTAASLALCGTSLTFPIARFAGLALLLALNVTLLRVNNEAWRVAGDTMAMMRDDALRLAGRDVRAEVVNLPDTIAGVYFDRGGWNFARLAPFGDGGGSGLAYRRVTLLNDLERPVAIGLEGVDTDLGPETPLPEEIAPGETLVLDWRFDPSAPGERVARLIGRGVCGGDGAATLLTVTAAGREAGPTPTGVWGTVVESEPATNGRLALTISVTSPAHAETAIGVQVSVPPEGPYAIEEAPAPFDLAGGALERVSLWLRQRADAPPWPAQPILVEADNAAPAPLAREQAMLLPPTGSNGIARADVFPLVRPGDAGAAGPLAISALCARTDGHRLDFGWLPVRPRSDRTGEPVIVHPTTPPIRLFWDDVRARLVPFDRAVAAPLAFAAGPAGLMGWTPYDEEGTHRHDAGMSMTALSRGPLGFTSPPIDIDPREVSYLLVEMRSMMSLGAFALFEWSRDGQRFVSDDFVLHVTSPDGRWKTYAVPLHSRPGWRDGGPIRQIRYFPSLNGGYAEIRSIRLIGPVPSDE